VKVEKETLDKYYELRDSLLKDWIDIELDSAYRSLEKQHDLREDMEEKYGVEYAWKYAAVPWYSEHHTWLALDICIKKGEKLIHENHEMIVECEIFEKIHAKMVDYGFIIRYPEWREDITGFEYEPWHLRYVWDVSIAKEIMWNWLTLEEYLEQKNK
jgi:D-alanyl-D-alanine carboxypeptidase